MRATINLGETTFDVLLALEKTLGDQWLYTTAADVADHLPLTTNQTAGSLRWLEREGIVRRNDAIYNGRSWWGFTDRGRALIHESY